MHESIIRSDGIGGIQTPEHSARIETVLPANGLAVDHPCAFRSKAATDDRIGMNRSVHVPHAATAAMMVRRTTVSSTGTL